MLIFKATDELPVHVASFKIRLSPQEVYPLPNYANYRLAINKNCTFYLPSTINVCFKFRT